jgi:hypothetical protein
MRSLPSFAMLSLLIAACDSGDAEPAPDAGVLDGSGGTDDFTGRCIEGVVAGDTPYFVERTEEWGLVEAGVQGVRMNVVDVDSDGWPDVLVRRGGTRVESYADDGQRSTWLLRNTGDGRFEDITLQSGIAQMRTALDDQTIGRPIDVPVFGDIDNDGRQDVYTGISTADTSVTRGETSEILVGFGDTQFGLLGSDGAVRRPDEIDAVAGTTLVDVDLDGDLDLFVAHHNYEANGSTTFAQDRLYLNDGTGEFTEVTTEFGLETRDWVELSDLNEALAHSRAWSAAACDLNNDMRPELLVASYGRAPNHLWQAGGQSAAVPYANVSISSGYAFDNDQSWSDNQFAACFCQENPGEEGCGEAITPAIGCTQPNWRHTSDREPYRLGGNSGATLCADIDNDGWVDLVTTEIRHWWAGGGADGSAILRNLGQDNVQFERVDRDQSGFVVPHPAEPSWDEGHMTGAILDIDNDGWQDIYIGGSDYPGNFGLMYRQTGPMQFERLPIESYFEHNRSHGVAVADFDRDGDLDMLIGHSRARCDAGAPNNCYETSQVRMFENQSGETTNWVQIDLQGVTANRDAIGARVVIETGDGMSQTRYVQSGFGHYGAQNDRVVHVGLGSSCEANVRVYWPDLEGSVSEATLRSGGLYTWVQGQTPFVEPESDSMQEQ